MVFFQKGKFKKLKIALICLPSLLLALSITVLAVSTYIKFSTEDGIVAAEGLGGYDCILVLGAAVRYDQPSHMLEDRLLVAVELYKSGAAPKLLMSGDHGQEDYDEVSVMKSFAVESGVPSEDVFLDHAGFSTYESVYRAIEIFGAKKIIIVTQKYHLHRALYVAQSLGAEAVGVDAALREYFGDFKRGAREILARNKDLLMCIFKPEPTFLGDKISLSGDGNITNDKN